MIIANLNTEIPLSIGILNEVITQAKIIIMKE